MQPRVVVFLTLAVSAAVLLGCDNSRIVDTSAEGSGRAAVSARPSPNASASDIATLIKLPSLSGRIAEALAVNSVGTAIAGYGWERRGTIRAVKWTLQSDGSWAISVLPLPATATGTFARAVNRAGDVAGYVSTSLGRQVVLWPAIGGFSVLGCGDLGEAHGISADAQVVVGASPVPAVAAVWRPGSCREDLSPLAAGGWSRAHAVNADGTIVGGAGAPTASGDALPVRWTQVAGAWQIEQLDSRRGAVLGANAAGDLAGYVYVPCALTDGCQRAVIWYAGGGARELGTLGGESSWANDINASGEVVGLSAPPTGSNTAFYWSESLGMLQLPVNGGGAAAYTISDVRPDGTRLVVGGSQGRPIAWVVREP